MAWESLLRGARASRISRDRPATLIVLGDEYCGKTSVVARMATHDDLSDNLVLDYTYVNVTDEDGEVQTGADADDASDRINVWQLVGKCSEGLLRQVALKDEDMERVAFMICLDGMKPWFLMESLNRWLRFLSDELDKIDWAEEQRDGLRARLLRAFQTYVEPTEGVMEEAAPMTDEEVMLLPLADGALTVNLGVPVIVAVCKIDMMSELQRQYAYKDVHFEFIQQHLRTQCLAYGASLIYVSGFNSINTDTLLRYVKHMLCNQRFRIKAEVVEKDRIFVPAGWDTKGKISILESSTLGLVAKFIATGEEATYERVIKEPFKIVAPNDGERIECMDDQQFLTHYRTYLERQRQGIKVELSDMPEFDEVFAATPTGRKKRAGRKHAASRLDLMKGVPPASTTTGASTGRKVTRTVPNDSPLAGLFADLLNKPKAAS